jgi:preprotein translocase subunit Sec63
LFTRYVYISFHDNLIYGRRGDAETGEGIALCKTVTQSGKTVFALITYVFPMLSARAVPQLVEFCQEHGTYFNL